MLLEKDIENLVFQFIIFVDNIENLDDKYYYQIIKLLSKNFDILNIFLDNLDDDNAMLFLSKLIDILNKIERKNMLLKDILKIIKEKEDLILEDLEKTNNKCLIKDAEYLWTTKVNYNINFKPIKKKEILNKTKEIKEKLKKLESISLIV